MSSSSELLLRLRHFVQSEAQVQWEEIRQQWNRPLPERVLKGWAVNNLSVEKIDGITVADDEREMLI